MLYPRPDPRRCCICGRALVKKRQLAACHVEVIVQAIRPEVTKAVAHLACLKFDGTAQGLLGVIREGKWR